LFDQDVEAAELVDSLVDQLLNRVVARHVALDRDRLARPVALVDRVRDRFDVLHLPRGDDHVRPVVGEALDDRLPDAARGSR